MQSYLISIAGNIAAGKSTLTQALEQRSGGRIVSFLERVDYVKENGYLEKYYEAVSAYDRLKGRKLDGRDRDGFLEVKEGQSVAQDRSIYEDQLFTKNSHNYEYITDEDYHRYLELFRLVMRNKPRPDLIIYLESDVATLKDRIRERSRGEESELAHPENRYLANLNVLYRPWIMKSGFPYLIIDTEAIDFRTEEGLDQVVDGIVRAVPDTRRLFDREKP
jgi:deoxyadenosine/deoxycytidine kinase